MKGNSDWLTNEDMIARARAGVAARERMRDTRKAAKPTIAELTAMVKAQVAIIQAQGRRITELGTRADEFYRLTLDLENRADAVEEEQTKWH